jgi:branched-chain amino acid transport system ATP-binding protein
MDRLLELKDLEVSFDTYAGEVKAVRGVSFHLDKGEAIAIVGESGCGKSVTAQSIMRLIPSPPGRVKNGSIIFDEEDLSGKATHYIVKKGITLVPEGRRVFPNLTVLENIKVGAYLRTDNLDDDIAWVYDLFPRLKERHWQLAGTLSGGEQQMLAVARALMSRPKLMMMDEPSLGLAPLVVREIFEIIKEINKQGVTILLIEQNASMALRTADRGYVLETGRITMQGGGKELLSNEDVKKAYLGA